MRAPRGLSKWSRSTHFCRVCKTHIERVYLGKPVLAEPEVTWVGLCECSEWEFTRRPRADRRHQLD